MTKKKCTKQQSVMGQNETKGTIRKIFEVIITEKNLNLMKTKKKQIQEAI